MTSDIGANLIAVSEEIFSHHATSNGCEKIADTLAFPPVLTMGTMSEVTLTSKSHHPCPEGEKTEVTDFNYDLQHLTAMQLRTKYAAEANSHRNMLTRSKRRGDKVHPAFREFRNFLRHVGPMPVSGATLDRINNTDREYGPGKVRWADKRTQNNNKGDTLTFYDPQTGRVSTASRLAKLQGVSPSTIRKRVERGWSDAEVIAGNRASSTPASSKHISLLRTEPRAHQYVEKPAPQVSARPRANRDIEFERMASYFAYCRKHEGEEPLPAPHHIINEDLPLGTKPVSEEAWLAHFKKFWPEYRPHLIFERADPYHQRAIEQIDPEYAKRERAKIAERARLKDQL